MCNTDVRTFSKAKTVFYKLFFLEINQHQFMHTENSNDIFFTRKRVMFENKKTCLFSTRD